MKRLWMVILLLHGIALIRAQNSNSFMFTTSYGLGYIDYGGKGYALPPESTNNIVSYLKPVGTFYSMELDYQLKSNNYVGVGFSRQHHSGRMNSIFRFDDNQLIFDNYQDNLNKTLVDAKFKKTYKYFNWGLGVFYYWEEYTMHSALGNQQGGTNIVFQDDINAPDQFGVYAGLAFTYPLRKNVAIGLQGKAYYSFAGFETISLAPFISFAF